MKSKRKLSNRERWVLAFAPAVAITGIYLYGYAGDLTANLEKAKKLAANATVAKAPAGPPTASSKAKATLEETTRAVAELQAGNDQLESAIETLPTSLAASVDDHDRAREIERVEAIFARNGITPVVSEAAADGELGDQALLAVLAPKLDGDTPSPRPLPRVWHCVFDDSTPHFKSALAELSRDVPAVIPLTFNLVYNPENNGQTRLLELWLLY